MHNKIEYISPSSFYYWEKCPLKGLYSKTYKNKELFPKHPDADIGTLIHNFYEKHSEWNINSTELFNAKWEQEINCINENYKRSLLQNLYYPVQWHSKFYAVKKQQLCSNILKSVSSNNYSSNRNNVVYEEWISNDYIGGYVDLIVKDGDIIKQIVDFKTGSIFEIVNNRKTIKEVYQQQLALYCAVILERQSTMPELYLKTLNGYKHQINIHIDAVKEIAIRALNLKEKINKAVENDDINSLAHCNVENCVNCNYRMFCKNYKYIFLNERCGKRIDLNGEVRQIGSNEILFEAGGNLFIIKNIKELKGLSEGVELSIYGLFYPVESELILYIMNNTIVYNE
ncbi:PD-(D/E)XK nuclease family protein [Carboxylicivirga linearis]|uniref:PD-(D/E)XK nuclease family protein n=1 Tax=Carboxylicivirga linearis TaxID=1628157 RepID=A0ABS5K0X6_9BACT|nr:PD-(D/E)XK nuclease family protein [Carboxylicivirga linearis]MBS2100827.1 PD-(D/E)XK nuclease family protein [Carboxylicivirga linearis]